MVILNLGEDKRHDMRAHFAAAAEMADTISATFPHPIELEFEKIFYPYLLYSKKRYAGRKFSSDPDKPDCVDVKGLALVRRDFAPLVKTASTAVLDALLEDRDAEKAVRIARAAIERVLAEPPGCPMDPYVISKTLRSGYANPGAQPHFIVARDIMRRTGQAVPSGSRVPYVFCVREDETLLGTKSEQAMDPVWAREHGMEIDKLYYIENQLLKPMCSLLEVVDERAERQLLAGDVAERLEALRTGEKAALKEQKRVKFVKTNRLQPISNFFKPVPK